MFGSGAGWAISVPNHTLQLTLGGVTEKVGVVRHQPAVREYMSVTMSFDHDLVDGAPAARFVQHLFKATACAAFSNEKRRFCSASSRSNHSNTKSRRAASSACPSSMYTGTASFAASRRNQ